MKKIILFDIDYTLFNTTKFKDLVTERISQLIEEVPKNLSELLHEVYRDARLDKQFNPSLFPKLLKQKIKTDVSAVILEQIWFDQQLMRESLYEETIPFLHELQKRNITLGIFSTGNSEFQSAKISLLEDVLHKDYIHIFSDKVSQIDTVVRSYKRYDLTLVDDFIQVLAKAKNLDTSLSTVWVKRGLYAEKQIMPRGFTPDTIITRLDEMLPFIDNRVSR